MFPNVLHIWFLRPLRPPIFHIIISDLDASESAYYQYRSRSILGFKFISFTWMFDETACPSGWQLDFIIDYYRRKLHYLDSHGVSESTLLFVDVRLGRGTFQFGAQVTEGILNIFARLLDVARFVMEVR